MMINGQEYVPITKNVDVRNKVTLDPAALELAGGHPNTGTDTVEIFFRVVGKKVE